MRQFTDNLGREWRVSFTIGHAESIKDLLGVDFLNILGDPARSDEPPPLTRLATDYTLLAQVTFILCEDQAKEQGIDQKQFYKALGGDAFRAAHEAVKGALSDFFQSLGRDDVVEMIRRQQEVIDKAVGLLQAKCADENFARHVDKRLAEEIESAGSELGIGNGSGRPPATSESTLDRSPTGNSSGHGAESGEKSGITQP